MSVLIEEWGSQDKTEEVGRRVFQEGMLEEGLVTALFPHAV